VGNSGPTSIANGAAAGVPVEQGTAKALTAYIENPARMHPNRAWFMGVDYTIWERTITMVAINEIWKLGRDIRVFNIRATSPLCVDRTRFVVRQG
jgi:hypothetical protein